jgi:HK97 family phage prohead protease
MGALTVGQMQWRGLGSAPQHEVKFTSLDLQRVESDGSFSGYASVFNREDLGGDIVAPGAFAESLARRGTSGIKMLFQHDANQPLGVWTRLEEDNRGLYAEGRLMKSVARAREVHALMQAGALDGLSIGFRTVKSRRDRVTGVRRILQADLWEISVVTFPLLPEARIASVKARPFAGAMPTERDLERWLTRDAGLSRSEARAVLCHGICGLKALRDAGQHGSEEAKLAARMRGAAQALRHTATIDQRK